MLVLDLNFPFGLINVCGAVAGDHTMDYPTDYDAMALRDLVSVLIFSKCGAFLIIELDLEFTDCRKLRSFQQSTSWRTSSSSSGHDSRPARMVESWHVPTHEPHVFTP